MKRKSGCAASPPRPSSSVPKRFHATSDAHTMANFASHARVSSSESVSSLPEYYGARTDGAQFQQQATAYARCRRGSSEDSLHGAAAMAEVPPPQRSWRDAATGAPLPCVVGGTQSLDAFAVSSSSMASCSVGLPMIEATSGAAPLPPPPPCHVLFRARRASTMEDLPSKRHRSPHHSSGILFMGSRSGVAAPPAPAFFGGGGRAARR